MISPETNTTNSLINAQTLQQAIADHRAGNLQEAERLYRKILQTEPNHPDANHNLGVLAVQVNQAAAGLAHFKTAVEANPNNGQYWLSYIDALSRTGQQEKALKVLNQGRQLGLSGEAIEALIRQLMPVLPPDYQHMPPPAKFESSKRKKTSSVVKTSRLKSPDPQVMNTLVELFNQRRYSEAETVAWQITERFPGHGFGWKALGAVLKRQGRIAESLEPTQKAAMLAHNDAESHNNLGLTFSELGRLDEAESSYRRALEIKPDYAEAHNNLGNVTHALGRLNDAEASYRRALEFKSDYAEAHNNLGNALQELGRPGESEASYRRALEIKPDYAEAHNNLGNTLKDMNRLLEAEASYRKALTLKPGHAENHYNLGSTLMGLGRLEEAEASYRRALEIKPDYADAHNNLGNTLKDVDRLKEAEVSYRRALEIKPDYAEAHNNLGNTLKDLDRLSEAEVSYRCALRIKPDYAEAHNNLGNILNKLGRLYEAESHFRRVLDTNPRYAEGHSGLGCVLHDLDRLEEAEASYRRALEIKPDLAETGINLGNTLRRLDRWEEAFAYYRHALSIKPDNVVGLNNLGTLWQDLGCFDEAEASFRRALEIKPGYSAAQCNLLSCMDYHPDLDVDEIFKAYEDYDARYGIPLRSTWLSHNNDRNQYRRLRIGYVSADFRFHVCHLYVEPLLSHHDKNQLEVYAYAELNKEDQVTARYKSYVDHWIPTKGMSDETLAARIRSDGIDILVDLAGNSAGNRLGVFARKPAPVSVSWHVGSGYTTGLSAIDYFLADENLIPNGSEGLFTEKPWRLSSPSFSYRPNEGMGEVNQLPARQRGYVTFGSQTRPVRINHRTIRVWSELLKALPDSKLVIDNFSFKDKMMQERLLSRLAEHGIERGRLEIGFEKNTPWEALRGIDISLDCFPNSVSTSLLVSLYMGVPYITLASRPSLGLYGSSHLRVIGHPEWIATSEEEYIAKAIELASDLDRLAGYRGSLRMEMERSSIFDETGFTRKVEEAYRQMWHLWCDKKLKT